MKNKTIILTTLILACTFFTASAQRNRVAQQRRALNAALNTMDKYFVIATIANDEAYYDFIDLFANKDTTIFNDLLGIRPGRDLTVEEYAKLLRYDLSNKMVHFRNVRNEGVTTEGGWTRIRISMDKSISYIDTCGTYYSSSDFYDGQDYRVTATLDYDSASNICKIVSLTGTIDSQKKLGERHFAFLRTNSRDNDVRYKGELLKFNTYNQALLEGGRDVQTLRKNFSFGNSDMELRPQTDDCQVTMRYKMRRWRLRPHFDIGLGKALSRDGDDIFAESKSTGTSFGLDIGISVLSKRRISLGVYTGLGLSMSSLKLLYTNSNYSFNTNADVDGDNYVRHYQDLTLSQKVKMNELNIPLYLDLNINLVKSLSLYIDLGARFDANIGHKVNDTEGSAYVYGIYPDYDNLRMDEHWKDAAGIPYNGFGFHQYGNSDLLSTDLLDVKGFTISGMGGFGLRYNLPRIPLSIEAGMSFVMGLTNLIETTNIANVGNNTPIVYNTISGKSTSTEHVHNLTEMINSIKRQQIRISIGLIYKF